MASVETLGLLSLIGATGGFIAGLVGLAGGIIIVPALVAMYGPHSMEDAIVISFFAVLLNSLSSSSANLLSKGAAAFWNLITGAKWYTIGAIVASCFVAILFGQYKGAIPTQLLATMQLILAISILIPRTWYAGCRFDHSKWKDSTAGSIVGGISTLIGIGGGTYTIFYFMIHGREIKDCTLTANFVGIFIGLMSLIGYYGYVAAASAQNVANSSGIIDGTGKAMLIISGVVAAPIGLKLQEVAPAELINKLIVFILVASSSYVFFAA